MSREQNIQARQDTEGSSQRDIREFVRVMAAYPELVALEPTLSFQEYCSRFFPQESASEGER